MKNNEEKKEYSAHVSVQKDDVLEAFQEFVAEDDLFVDLTFGAGGHTRAMAEMGETIKIISFDQDPDALANGRKILEANNLSHRVTLVDSNFEKYPQFFKDNPELFGSGAKGILMDLGVSSHHFDDLSRGFSFRGEAALDMRMNNREGQTAKDLVNELDVEELELIFREYGEERFSARIAEEIVEKRETAPIETTKDLENIIFHCYPKKMRFGKTNPSTRCFQALRIAVNRELDVLKDTIPGLVDSLCPYGKLAIISFHSLEDRIVKHTFKAIKSERDDVKILTKRPLIPSEKEISNNPRSRSAKLRILMKI